MNEEGLKIKQLLIVSIQTILTFFIFSFCLWVYITSKKEQNYYIEKKMIDTKNIIQGLSKLKKKELSLLVTNIVSRPLLKSALQTGHKETIEDVLKSIKEKNNIDFILALKGKRINYSFPESDLTIKEIVKGHFLGKGTYKDFIILIGKKLYDKDLNYWSEISKSNLFNSNNDFQDTSILVSPDNTYFYSYINLLKKTLNLEIRINSSIFKERFKKKRNSLLFLGLLLSLLSLIVSIVFVNIFYPYIVKKSNSSSISFEDLIKEIEVLKKKI